MNNVKKSFIREILNVTRNPEVISFAGGLPNPATFPVDKIKNATDKVLIEDGEKALQYSTTEGYLPLRKFISERYLAKEGIDIDPDEIMITNGAQQGIDLLGKVLLNENDDIVIERPGYIGAIQALSVYGPAFHTVPILKDGVDTDALEPVVKKYRPKLFYAVTNFQNPTGATYSAENKKSIAKIMKEYNMVFAEDNPYGELRFAGKDVPSMRAYLENGVVMLGSFSKIIAPALRIGWVCAKKEIMEKLLVAKQASDLHTNSFSQRIVHEYLKCNNIDDHIMEIKALYKNQKDCMIETMNKYFPDEVAFTEPEGGMFIWARLPEGCSSLQLFEIAKKENVIFVPGEPFYASNAENNTMRLNYTNSTPEMIEAGIKRLGKAIKSFIIQR